MSTDDRAAFERFVDLFSTQKRAADAFAQLVAHPAVADTYRFDDGRIVEHWDVRQQVPVHAVHDHPMF